MGPSLPHCLGCLPAAIQISQRARTSVFIDSIYPDAVQTGGNIGIRTFTQAYPIDDYGSSSCSQSSVRIRTGDDDWK